jgi:hypothetical protein
VKRDCDKIGYCCFSSEDQNCSGVPRELDLRTLPPPQRHALIFEVWADLKSGEAMRIINDHDPKPIIINFKRNMAAPSRGIMKSRVQSHGA